MAAPQDTSTVPLLGRRILEALLAHRLSAAGRDGDHPDARRRLVLVHGRYDPADPTEFTVRVDGAPRDVTVAQHSSVLGITAAWHDHRAAVPDGDGLLVVVTGVPDAALGWDLRGHAVRGRVLNADRVEIVRQRFGATRLDPRIRAERWLVDALLDAEPRDGWPQVGGVLTRDTALRALAAARLDLPGGDDTVPDADTLLAWSRTSTGPDRFAALDPAEQTGITDWLADVAGPAVRPLMALVAEGRGHDAMPLGVVGSAVHNTAGVDLAKAGFALGTLFGRGIPTADLQAFAAVVEGTLARWLADHRQDRSVLRDRALEVLRRADALAADADLTDALAANPYLPSAFEARLRALADALTRSPENAEHALARLREHRLAPLWRRRVRTAEAAVRLVRRLAHPGAGPTSVADGVTRHLADWGWVDAALTVLWAGDADADAHVAAAYTAVCHRVRQWRAELDAEFARRLAQWARTADQAHTTGGCLLVEDVLAEVVAPLYGDQVVQRKDERVAPLVVVLDGMSSAVAVTLAADLTARGAWVEAGRRPDVRDAAVAMIPSVTRTSRTALLSGAPGEGGQAAEKDGFAAFWRARRIHGAALFHKADIAGHAGRRFSDELQTALADASVVVGVVLNTIDEALDHSPQGDRTGWRPHDITHLEELLDAARSYGRPVVLVSDHGHVLDRGDSTPTRAADGPAEAARWRTGTPQEGEVTLSGPRVREGGGTVVVPWREDIRYTQRRGGYHGGASLAEMTVPVLVLLPSTELLPKGWQVLEPDRVTPAWWTGGPAERPAAAPAAPAGRTAAPPAPPREERTAAAPAPVPEPAPEETRSTLGWRVVESKVYEAQRKYVPAKRWTQARVAAVIDALVESGGTMSATAAAARAGFQRTQATGLMTVLQRLLNVEGYPVLEIIDNGARLRLNTPLARQQFHLDP
ncbi:BREX-2 system phosphatase PglZ [Thermobifida halotolerans]|uniref:BREX-2 system phosphatase PglZ n=1 Tax=Thermobifida halotolerans TaxID=483545 RepID=A0AA97M3L1_9ACTN|nr:BREX-2 system phosphatase PglZ [Thermobifida halotolerans]UOE19097.1 BREX-2 system phosphatase PglZ [Thermobifida halotolerans]